MDINKLLKDADRGMVKISIGDRCTAFDPTDIIAVENMPGMSSECLVCIGNAWLTVPATFKDIIELRSKALEMQTEHASLV